MSYIYLRVFLCLQGYPAIYESGRHHCTTWKSREYIAKDAARPLSRKLLPFPRSGCRRGCSCEPAADRILDDAVNDSLADHLLALLGEHVDDGGVDRIAIGASASPRHGLRWRRRG